MAFGYADAVKVITANLDDEPKYGPVPFVAELSPVWDELKPAQYTALEAAGMVSRPLVGAMFATMGRNPEDAVKDAMIRPYFIDLVGRSRMASEVYLPLEGGLRKPDFWLKTSLLSRQILVEAEGIGNIQKGIAQIKEWLPDDEGISIYRKNYCGLVTDGYHYLFYLPDPTYDKDHFKWLNLNIVDHSQTVSFLISGDYDLAKHDSTDRILNQNYEEILNWMLETIGTPDKGPTDAGFKRPRWSITKYWRNALRTNGYPDPDEILDNNITVQNKALVKPVLHLVFMRFMEELDIVPKNAFKNLLMQPDSWDQYRNIFTQLGSGSSSGLKSLGIPHLGGPFFVNDILEPRPGYYTIEDAQFSKLVNVVYSSLKLCASETECADPTKRFNMDVLGHLFEKINDVLENGLEAARVKKNRTAIYTPDEVTHYMTKVSVDQWIAKQLGYQNWEDMLPEDSEGYWSLEPEEHEVILEVLPKVTILDPAAGSGAFLTAAYNYLSELYLLSHQVVYGESPPSTEVYGFHYDLIHNQLYGNEIMPVAAEILKMRMYLALMEDAQYDADIAKTIRKNKLGGLDKTISCGDSLVGYTFRDLPVGIPIPSEYTQTHPDYLGSKELADSEFYGEHKTKYEDIINETPMTHWPLRFPDVGRAGGFDIVLMNPPYASPSNQQWLKEVYGKDGIKLYNEIVKGRVENISGAADLAYIFISRSRDLVNESGIISSINPATFLTAQTYPDFRNMMAPNTKDIISFEDKVIFQGAAVFPSIQNYDLGQTFETTRMLVRVEPETYAEYQKDIQVLLDELGWDFKTSQVSVLGQYPADKATADFFDALSSLPKLESVLEKSKRGLDESLELGKKNLVDTPTGIYALKGMYVESFSGFNPSSKPKYIIKDYTTPKGVVRDTDELMREFRKYDFATRRIVDRRTFYPYFPMSYSLTENYLPADNIMLHKLKNKNNLNAILMIMESAVAAYWCNATRGQSNAVNYSSVHPLPLPAFSYAKSWEALYWLYPWSQSLATDAEIAQFRRVLNRVALESYFSESSDVAEAVLECGDTAAAEELSLEPFLELLMNESQTREFYDLLVSKGYEFVSEPEDEEVVVMSAENVAESFRPVIRFGMATAGVLGVISLVQWLQSLRDD